MTRGGKKFYVTFIDDYSRFTRVYLLRNKDEAFDMFLSYKAKVENQLDRKIKRIRSDRGGEYIPLNDYCENEGIIHKTPPYSLKLNGIAERKNRTLKEMINSLLVSALTPDNLWGEAILSVYHLQNRISYKKTGKTSYYLWKGHAPNLKYLKVWRCLGKVMLPNPKKRKIGSKTSNSMFIGYSSNSAAYRFLVLKSDVLECNTIIEIKNVEFFEHIFPLSKKISHTPTILDDIENSYDEHMPTTMDDMESSHDELRRSKRQRKEVSFRDDFYTYLIENESSFYFEAISFFDSLLWKEAIKTEFDSILKNQTSKLVDLPSRAKPIGYK